MPKKEDKKAQETAQAEEPQQDTQVTAQAEEPQQDTQQQDTQEQAEQPSPQERIAELEQQLEKEKKEYLFLMADFDNFRKRTIKEKIELMKNGSEKAMADLLPVIDDFERALQAIAEQTDTSSLRQGVELIYNKFLKYLEANGVKPILSDNATFDTELHEAVANFPTPEEELKGKIIDTVQKGYMINDKVLRHAKVVVGQ